MIGNRRFTARELTGKERMFLQICHNLWKWIKDGHGASSFFSTVQGKNALSDIEKISGKSGMQAENEVLALYDKVDNLAFKIDREKRLDHPEVKKAEFEFDSYMGDFNSTRLGKIIAEEIANDMGIRTASLAVRKGSRYMFDENALPFAQRFIDEKTNIQKYGNNASGYPHENASGGVTIYLSDGDYLKGVSLPEDLEFIQITLSKSGSVSVKVSCADWDGVEWFLLNPEDFQDYTSFSKNFLNGLKDTLSKIERGSKPRTSAKKSANRRSIKRKASTEWWHGIEGAWYGGSKPMYGSWIFYWGVPIDSDDLWGNLREVYESECEYNGTEYTEEGFDKWLETDSGIDALETELQIIAEGEFLYYRDKVYDIFRRIMMDGGKADEDSSDIFDLITSSDKYRVPGSARFTKDVADSIGIKAEEEKAAFVEAVQDKSLKDVFDLKDILKWYLS